MEMENDLEALYKQKEDLESELAPFEEKKKQLYKENQDKVDRRERLKKEIAAINPGGIVKIIVCIVIALAVGIPMIGIFTSEGATSIDESGKSTAIGFLIVWVAIPVILAIVFTAKRLAKTSKLKPLQRELQRFNTELSRYDQQVSELDHSMSHNKLALATVNGKIKRIIQNLKYANSKYAKNHIIVFAGATYNDHLDDNVHREVIIDGYSHGSATPWLIVGVNPGYHTICVNYRDGQYSGNTNVISFTADDCSKIYACKKGDSSYLRTDPLYEIGELDNLLSSVRSDEKSRFPDKSIL